MTQKDKMLEILTIDDLILLPKKDRIDILRSLWGFNSEKVILIDQYNNINL